VKLINFITTSKLELMNEKTQQKNHGDVLNDSLANIIAELKKEKGERYR